MVCLPAKNSATGTRTRVARVRAEYPNQLDYSECCKHSHRHILNNTFFVFFGHNSYVSGLAAELFFPDSGLWRLTVASGRPGSACASMFLLVMPEAKWDSKNNLTVSG